MSDPSDYDRLKHLSDQIAEIRAEESAEKAKDAENLKNADNMGVGARAGAELISCFIAGGLIGWALDRQFGTQPILLIVFLLTGICVGFYEVYRITKS
ncbi:MAG TPA: AtpZ/AtpI family protein [Micavibrio sp.]